MQVCMEKWSAEQLAKVLSLIECANNMSHNETTWERKQAAIADGLGIVKDLLATAVEYDITAYSTLLRQSLDLTAKALDVQVGSIQHG